MSNNDFNLMKKNALEISNESIFSSAFPFFCLRIYFPELSDEQITNAIYGLGSNDESIDAFWINDTQKIIYIVQFKSVEHETSMAIIKKDVLAYLSEVENKLNDYHYISNHKNKRIKDDIFYDYNEYTKKGYITKKQIYHLGYPNKDLLEHYSNMEYFGYDDIFTKWMEYDSINTLTDPEECLINVSFKECNQDKEYGKIIRFKPTSKYGTIITMITGDELVKLREIYRFQLFDRNVRYYLGSNNRINKEIYDTAKNKPDNFYYYNNGITITCYRCRPSTVNDTVRMNLEIPQIINGAQTVNAIYEAYCDMLKKKKADIGDDKKAQEECKKHFSKIKVLCRIIESTKHAEADFSLNLTRYTNSQNSVNVSDFYANRPEQIEIQSKLLKYGYFYERKRGERDRIKKNENNEFKVKFCDLTYSNIDLDLPKLAGIFQAYKGKPSAKEVGDKYILDPNRTDYNILFGSSRSDITDAKIKEIVLAINIFFSVEYYSKKYNKLIKLLAKIEEAGISETSLTSLKKIITELDFLPNNLKNDIQKMNEEDNFEDNELIRRLYNYKLLSQGKYLITALINEILNRKQAKDKLFEDSVFSNYEYVSNNITTMWINKIIVKLINPIREKEKDKRSDGAFFLDQSLFKVINEKLSNMIYEEDLDINTDYPL